MLIWIRDVKKYQKYRNITLDAVKQLKSIAKARGMLPVCIGNKMNGLQIEDTDLIEFYNDSLFQKQKLIFLELCMFNELNKISESLVSVGMMSGAMDGPAFIGVSTIWVARNKNARRMKKFVPVVHRFKHAPIKYLRKFKRFSEEELKIIKNFLGNTN